MKTRRFIVFLASAISVGIVICVVATTCWQRTQPAFRGAPELMSAVHAFSHDVTASGKPLPDTVSLHELVNGGYISAADVHAFDGMDVTISLKAGEADPQAILMRARVPDGSVTALMADGSV
jgi:hypothetical protein